MAQALRCVFDDTLTFRREVGHLCYLQSSPCLSRRGAHPAKTRRSKVNHGECRRIEPAVPQSVAVRQPRRRRRRVWAASGVHERCDRPSHRQALGRHYLPQDHGPSRYQCELHRAGHNHDRPRNPNEGHLYLAEGAISIWRLQPATGGATFLTGRICDFSNGDRHLGWRQATDAAQS
jgi:hypothetical protein